MLQLSRLNRRACEALEPAARTWQTPAELDILANAAIAQLRALRGELASGPLERLAVWIDRRVASDGVEYLDRPDYPQDEKLRQVRILHVQNRVLGSYRRFLQALRPVIEASAAARTDGRARLLELASGAGEMALALSSLARRDGLPVTIEGSDIVDAYVADANRRARDRKLDARFRKLDAFELAGVQAGEIDVVFIAQSIHHFTPGQLARMIARVEALGARHFIGLDGRRSALMLAMLPLLAAVTLHPQHTHDALLSARKFYSAAELALVAELAAPHARVSVEERWPGLELLRIDYAAGPQRAGQ